MCINVKAKYASHSTSATDDSRKEIDEKTEALYDHQHQHMPMSCASEDVMNGNPSSCLLSEGEQTDLLLTDIIDVINQDSEENCDISSNSTSCHPACDLQAAISNAQATTELSSSDTHVEVNQCSSISSVHVCLAAELPAAVHSINTAGTLPYANLGNPDNRLSAAFTAQQKKSTS